MKKSIIFLLTMLTLSCIIICTNYIGTRNENTQILDFLTVLYSERIKSTLNSAVEVTDILDKIIVLEDGDIKENDILPTLDLAYDSSIHLAISYMPNGIVAYSHPIEQNSIYLGYNVLEDEEAKHDALKAIETKQITFSGPYRLSNSVPAFVARNPVFIEKEGTEVFWGFISMVMDPTKILSGDTGLADIEQIGYEYNISSTYNDNAVELYKSENFDSDKAATSLEFELGQGLWHISIYNVNARSENVRNTILTAIALLAVTTLLYLLFRNSELQRIHIQEQSLIDSLTKVYNRKGLEFYSKKNTHWTSEGCSIFFIDLNKFKPVNDTYGHEVGDKLLYTFAARLLSHFKKNTFIGRYGGDEFIVIIPRPLQRTDCKSILERIIHLSETTFFVETLELHISASVGYAVLPNDGTNFAEVMDKADKAMFVYKEEHRKGR